MPFPNSGAVNLSTKTGVTEFLFAKLNTQQSANIAGGDHLKFDTVIASRGGSIALDTATAYSNANGAASIGRLTLKAGLTYRLRASLAYILGSGATGLLEVQFADVTAAPAGLNGVLGVLLVSTTATNDVGNGVAEAVVTTTQDTLVELRINNATALTQIGTTGARVPTLSVETL
jgi:hypothetical protein